MVRAMMPGSANERGVALVEFALVVPILVVLLFGIWEFGRLFESQLIVTNAAREGARYAIEGDSDVQTRVVDYLTAGFGDQRWLVGDISSYDVDVARSPTGSGPVTVTVQAGVQIVAPLPWIFPESVVDSGVYTITSQAVMRQ